MTGTELDLFHNAADNARSLDEQLSSALSKCETEVQTAIRQFMKWLVEEACVSLNVRPAVLACFIHTGVYQNIHEWALEQEALSGRSMEECLREKLGRFYDRRMAFDGAFRNGERFRYGALNAGGPGSTRWGRFCVVLAREFIDRIEVCYLPEDSLAICFSRSGELDLSRVLPTIAPHSHRHVLAAIKHLDAIPATPRTAWATLVLSDSSYIEAVFAERFCQEDVDEVRVRQEDYQCLWDLAFSDYRKKLGMAKKALVLDFITIVKASRSGVFTLEVLS